MFTFAIVGHIENVCIISGYHSIIFSVLLGKGKQFYMLDHMGDFEFSSRPYL